MTTKAYNLSQFANKINSSGQVDASTGLTGIAPSSAELQTANFTWQESGGKMALFYGATLILTIDVDGSITSAANITSFGTP